MNRLIEFSTAGLPAEQRIALWEDHNRSALIGLRCRMLSESLFDGTEINLQLDRMHVARVRGNAHVVERPAEVIRRNPADAIAVYLAVAGEAFFYHDDGVVTLRPGQVLICDADRPFLRGFSRGLEEIAIKVPRATFREVSGLDELRAPLVREDLSARTLAKLAGRALRDPAADEATLLSLLAAMVNPGHEVGAAHLANAHAFIDDHLTEIGLNAPRVAGAIGVSERICPGCSRRRASVCRGSCCPGGWSGPMRCSPRRRGRRSRGSPQRAASARQPTSRTLSGPVSVCERPRYAHVTRAEARWLRKGDRWESAMGTRFRRVGARGLP